MNEPQDVTPHQSGLPAVGPDAVDIDLADDIDNVVPSFGYNLTPVVGLGGSAGSIKALQVFFQAMPTDSGLVFVVILHLSPEHASMMPEMIQRWTRMPTVAAENGQKLLVNHVYVIPPGKHLTATNGHLKLTEMHREQGRRVAVDLFFRSLAESHGPHAAAIVFSGADGDGMIGIKRIKERGGLTIAQDPSEAEQDSMPRMAISTGMVDWVLPTDAIPRKLIEYITHGKTLQLPPEEGSLPPPISRATGGEHEAAFREVLILLRTRTGRDFSYYKRATILRRISRRMQVNGVADIGDYLSFLRVHPGECGALLKELLISVSNFFRDRESFAALAASLPDLFEGKGQFDTVRVWCPACATGEEAYSIAIMLTDFARTLDVCPGIQVFGCDLDEDAIQVARAGIFPQAIAADVSEDQLRRFFVKEHSGYRVRREIRETVLFASHDLLKDAPFSRIDLLSCRNLLIYLNRAAQSRAMDIFNFALRPGGVLFLGSSESVDEGSSQFAVLDKKHRIYRRLASERTVVPPISSNPSSRLVRQIEQQIALAHAGARHETLAAAFAPATLSQTAAMAIRGTRRSRDDKGDWTELHLKLLERFGPPSIVVDRDYEIRHISETAGRFLQVGSGVPSTNLLHLVKPELRLELRALLFRAVQSGEPALAFHLPLVIDGQEARVSIEVAPAADLDDGQGFQLVLFRLQSPSEPPQSVDRSAGHDESLVQHLEREIEQVKSHLRDTVEQYEASTEELKASNEELQAMNEELRSASEELETSREELQSINEELTAVNLESKSKLEELGQANSDLQNLMSATAIATVFLDRELKVMRFTQPAAPIFNLISGDIGRPLSHLRPQIRYPNLAADAERVLQTLSPIEREVQGAGDTCYLARMLPYRTIEDRIAGVVLTFVDITERQRAAAALLAQNEQLERFNQATIGRELRMVELKMEINALLERMGEPARYRGNTNENTKAP